MSEVVEDGFKPCVIINNEAGTIDICIEDCPCVAVPLVEGVYHWVDKQLAIDDGRFVGVTIWQHAPEALKEHAPPPQSRDGKEKMMAPRLGPKQASVLKELYAGGASPTRIMSDRYARHYYGMSCIWRLHERGLIDVHFAILGMWFGLTEAGRDIAKMLPSK